MSNNLFLLLNIFFMCFFFKKLVTTDYTGQKMLWYSDGLVFALNFSCILLHIWG